MVGLSNDSFHYIPKGFILLNENEFNDLPETTENEISVKKWAQMMNTSFYLPGISEENESIDFITHSVFCSVCQEWLIFKRHSKRLLPHLESFKHIRKNERLNQVHSELSEDERTFYLENYLYKSAIPFTHFENPDLRKISPHLCCRQTASSRTKIYGKLIKIEIKKQLELTTEITLIIDEWTAPNKLIFLGVIFACQLPEKINVEYFLVSFDHLPEVKIDSNVLFNHISKIISDYAVSNKVHHVVSDSTNLMPKTISLFSFK